MSPGRFARLLTAVKLRVLPVLEPSRESLELCVYCPKLCRAACPVSNETPRETLIPWGKMSAAYFMARGSSPVDPPHAATAWACTGCHRCTERCDHRNDVAGTLEKTRAALFAAGPAEVPAGARRVARGFASHQRRTREAMARVSERAAGMVDPQGPALLVGCAYARALPGEAASVVQAFAALAGEGVRPIGGCCGQPLLHAGDEAGFALAARALAQEVGPSGELLVVDPGCAATLRGAYRDAGLELRVTLLVELSASRLSSLRPLSGARSRVRYHDPCQLGRGLGIYDEPRAVLTRLFGEAPLEFPEARAMAGCSGAGGLLPQTMPETSRGIARARREANERAGGGEVVTACASSLRALRAAGAQASDLSTWIAKGLGRLRATGGRGAGRSRGASSPRSRRCSSRSRRRSRGACTRSGARPRRRGSCARATCPSC